MGKHRMSRAAWGPALAVMTAAVLAACGGGGDSGGSAPATPASVAIVQGTAASGAFMPGASVSMVDATGATVGSQVADGNGHYAFDVSNFQAPFAIVATGTANGAVVNYVAVVAEKPAPNSAVTVNVTPLTTAVVALLAASGGPVNLNDINAIRALATPAQVQRMVALLRTVLSNIITEAGLDASTFDPMATPLTVQGQGADKVLDRLLVTLITGGVKLTSLGADLSGHATDGPSVTLTAGSPDNPPRALPTPVVNVDAATFDSIRQALQACYALPRTSRVQGGVALNACAQAFSSDYLHNSYSVGDDSSLALTSDDNSSATFSAPVVVYSSTNELGEQTVLVRFPLVRPDGTTGVITRLVTNRNGVWTLTGNQRSFEAAVTRRISRVIEQNPVAGSVVSRYETALRLLVNPMRGTMLGAQVVRVTGPGLPAAGVVLTRSTACGTFSEMVIQNTNGSLVYAADDPVYPNATIFASNQAASTLALAATPVNSADTLTWSALTGGAVRYAPTPLPDSEIEALPTFGEYTFAVWNRNFDGSNKTALNATPDLTFTLRTSGPVRTPASLASEAWNTVNASTLTSYLTPGSGATASVNVQWTVNAEVVDRAVVYAYQAAQPLPVRFALQASPASHSATAATVTANQASSNLNGACQVAALPAMAGGDFRTVELRSTTADDTQKFTRVVGRTVFQ